MKFCKNCNNLIKNNFCSICKTNEIIEHKSDQRTAIKNSKNRIQEESIKEVVSFDCPVCHHNKANYEIIQMRALDEAPTEFYTCEKCNYCKRI